MSARRWRRASSPARRLCARSRRRRIATHIEALGRLVGHVPFCTAGGSAAGPHTRRPLEGWVRAGTACALTAVHSRWRAVAQKRAPLRGTDLQRIAVRVGASTEAVGYVMSARGVRVKAKAGDETRLEVGCEAFESFLLTHRGSFGRAPKRVVGELERLRAARLVARHEQAIGRLLAALAAAGVPAHLTSDGRAVAVDGTRVLVPRPGEKWGHGWVMQKIAREALDQHFVRRVADNLDGLPLRALPTSDGIVLSRGDRVIGRVSATRAVVAPRTRTDRAPAPINGNFLADGPHWQRLRAALSRLAPTRAARTAAVQEDPFTPPAQVLTELPDSVATELRDVATVASQLIREERTVAFAHTVEMRIGSGESVRVAPIRADGGPIEAPFVYETDTGRVAAAIRLKSPRDPMAIALEAGSDPELVGGGWVTALVAFADLTCVPQSPGEPRNNPPVRRRGASPLGSSRPPTRHGQTTLSGRLAPSSQTAALLASYVVGHRRRLRDGQAASAQARKEAELAGITLRPRETWVRPHVRGAPEDTVLVFDWTPPDVLAPTTR